jgi:hypothetical protein
MAIWAMASISAWLDSAGDGVLQVVVDDRLGRRRDERAHLVEVDLPKPVSVGR